MKFGRGGLGMDFIQSAMFQKRFSFLLSGLRLDNIMDRRQGNVVDNLAPVKVMFERFILN
jgi:hypothetical protein